MVCCTIAIAYAQFLLKSSINATPWQSLALNGSFLLGLALVGTCGLALTYALKHGELSALHPLVGLGIFWVTLVSIFFLGEPLTLRHGAGIAIIIAGIALISHSGRRA